MSRESPDPRNLAVRKFDVPTSLECAGRGIDIIGEYATDPPLVVRGLLDALAPAAKHSAQICEMGFGGGWLLDELRSAFPDAEIIGLDLSESLTQAAHASRGDSVHIVRGDIEAPPFLDGSLDAVATCWTLYFMRDIDAALEGIAQCLRPGGRFVAATVAADNMREYAELCDRALRQAGAVPEPDVSDRFDLASGRAYVERHFDDVALVEWRGELVLDEVGLLLELWPMYGGGAGLSEEQDMRARDALALLCAERIAQDGTMRITRHSGAFVSEKRR